MSQDALHGDDAAGVALPRAINHAHAAASDLFEDLVVAEAPLFVRHVRFREHAFEDLSGCLALSCQSLAEEAVHANSLAHSRGRAATLALSRILGRA